MTNFLKLMFIFTPVSVIMNLINFSKLLILYNTTNQGVLSMKKFIIFICSLTVILSSLVMPVSAQNYIDALQKSEDESKKLHCKVDYMINMEDGAVIFDNNSDVPVAPASLTKIMTALVVLRNIKDLNQTVTVSPIAIESLYGTGRST